MKRYVLRVRIGSNQHHRPHAAAQGQGFMPALGCEAVRKVRFPVGGELRTANWFWRNSLGPPSCTANCEPGIAQTPWSPARTAAEARAGERLNSPCIRTVRSVFAFRVARNLLIFTALPTATSSRRIRS